MDAAEFDFTLPPDLIAQMPARPRDAARLLAVEADRNTDRHIADLPSLLRPGDVLVANDTRVIPAQLAARRGEARIGVTLDQPQADGSWHALLRNGRRVRAGDELRFDGASATVLSRDDEGGARLRFSVEGADFEHFLRDAGRLALPPYIARPAGPTEDDAADYQTIFGRHDGAVAAPTAGLHFTPALLDALAARGVQRETVTLHVGAGTFLPMRADTVAAHTLHPERGIITAAAADRINAARARGGRIVAVGTTSLRLLESAADETGRIAPFDAQTRLFIKPGHRFRTASLLLTNFHLPRSTLFMLTCAFAGTARMQAAYAHAIAAGYRFYSYGDACLLAAQARPEALPLDSAGASGPRPQF
ncbi:tRNA preQ1(34) S-adenosylmethionine ribosyltransferase-isomerase QueA [Lichenicoccus sp.]|uniref:tRNA preQ1(34) S-adenosylmethionine ribosyltransferase-isomerase QueA n=1 Tax=Lichenicoccus sp. TaxID=2781899 RepID=UPI003D11EA2B